MGWQQHKAAIHEGDRKSCFYCHQPETAFTENFIVQFAPGFVNRQSLRSSFDRKYKETQRKNKKF